MPVDDKIESDKQQQKSLVRSKTGEGEEAVDKEQNYNEFENKKFGMITSNCLEEFEQYSKLKIANLEAEMKSIGVPSNKRYQILRKRRDGQKYRMEDKLKLNSLEQRINLINDVMKAVISETQATLSDSKRLAFKRDLAKALKKMQ